MPKPRINDLEAQQMHEYLRSNPDATYVKVKLDLWPDRDDINVNSLMKKLQRDGKIEIIEIRDEKGKFLGTRKVVK